MSDKLFCSNCDEFVDYKIKEQIEQRNILNKMNIEILSKIAFCKKCNSELFHEKLEKENQRKAFRKYNKSDNEPKIEIKGVLNNENSSFKK
jgi:hypothetical protein